jgi:hypothetical protein
MRSFREGARVRLTGSALDDQDAARRGTVLGTSEVYASVLWDDGERERVCMRRLADADRGDQASGTRGAAVPHHGVHLA